MNWLLGLSGDTWIKIAAGVFCFALGASVAWTVQGWRLDASKAEYAAFVAQTKAAGEIAAAQAKAKDEEYKRLKEKTDEDHAKTVAALNADIKRLRNARDDSGYLPKPPTGAKHPERACFKRNELESAIRQLDAGVSEIIAGCDVGRVDLDSVKIWMKSIKSSP